jgi:hypothetical protein
MISPPHRSSSVKSDGISSSPRSITSSLQQLALHEAQVIAASVRTAASVAFGSVSISLAMRNLALHVEYWLQACGRTTPHAIGPAGVPVTGRAICTQYASLHIVRHLTGELGELAVWHDRY